MFNKVGITNNPENTRKFSKINFKNFSDWKIIDGPYDLKEEALDAATKFSKDINDCLSEVYSLSEEKFSKWYIYSFSFGKNRVEAF